MPYASGSGVRLYYEELGSGEPLVWCHEFAGSHDSWDQQRRFFADRYRVISFNARGYPPSDVPEDRSAYSQQHAVDDLHGLVQDLGIDRAHVGGLSMGGTTALHFGLQQPERVRSLIVAGAGTGSTDPEQFAAQTDQLADRLERDGMDALRDYARGPTRVRLERKDATAYTEFTRLLAAHSAPGSALTLPGVQGERAPLHAYETELQTLALPTLILVGDEDEPCLKPALYLKRQIQRSGLVVFPLSGHAINLEEPELFNRTVLAFLDAVEADQWPAREEGSGAGFLAPRGP
jgi:pimeloyl-ACP methyl ester carboxylesterase